MDLTRKIGQLMMVGIPGTELTPEVSARLRRWHPGGIILFARNLVDPSQAQKLSADLNSLLSSPKEPLWFCVDQEGGVVVRMTRGVSVFPGNMALGATGNADYAYEAGKLTALEWGELGVNVNLAPVLDLSYSQNPAIGVRSLGQNKEEVARLGVELIRGMQDHGMFATAKHFPGKGLARQDSHLALPVIEASARTLKETEAYPFQASIDARVGFVMTSHCLYSALDPENPATVSRRILRDLLREEMGFQGLVISDDLEMGAISKVMPVEEAAVRFLQAGGDQILVCHTPEAQEKVFAAVLKAVQTKQISEKEIDQKLERIFQCKQTWLGSRNHPELPEAPAGARMPPAGASGSSGFRMPPARASGSSGFHDGLPLQIARDSITIVKNSRGLVPLRLRPEQRLHLYCPDYAPLTQVEEEMGEKEGLLALFQRYHPKVTQSSFPIDVAPSRIPPLIREGKEAELVLIFTYNAHLNPTQGAFVREILHLGKPAVVCAIRNPYDWSQFPDVEHYLVSYGFRRSSFEALADVLFGKTDPRGKLPVNLK